MTTCGRLRHEPVNSRGGRAVHALFRSGLPFVCATRDFIESHVRDQVRALPNVRFMDRTQVTGLIAEPGSTRVVGVRVRHRPGRPDDSAASSTDLMASLVVDPSGRESKLPAWLASLGIERIDETTVDPALVYASQFLRISPDAVGNCRAILIQASLPDHPREAVLFPVEGDRWHLTLIGYAGAAPRADAAGLAAFARELRDRRVADLLEIATPLTLPVAHRRTQNRLRHFERVAGWPEGLVALGDAACAFDPVYGQGYFDRVLRVATVDPATRARLLAVMNMERPPTTLFHPAVVAGVLRDTLWRRAAAASTPVVGTDPSAQTASRGRDGRIVARAS